MEEGFQEGYKMGYKTDGVRVLMMALEKPGGKASLLIEGGKSNTSVNKTFSISGL